MEDKIRIHLNNIYLLTKERNRLYDLWLNATNAFDMKHYKLQRECAESELQNLLSELGRM